MARRLNLSLPVAVAPVGNNRLFRVRLLSLLPFPAARAARAANPHSRADPVGPVLNLLRFQAVLVFLGALVISLRRSRDARSLQMRPRSADWG